MHLHIGQNQYNTHHNRQKAVSHEVTCNPTDDTAHDDELSNRFAPHCSDSNHQLHPLYNQMNHHGSHYTHSNGGANVAQQMQTFCPMLPPLQNEHTQYCTHQVNVQLANVNHHLHHQLHHNPQMHYSTNPSFKMQQQSNKSLNSHSNCSVVVKLQ